MYNYKLTIAYDGTNYSGWQIQPHHPTIQELIEKALQTVLRQKVTLIGSGRTDAGVHARGQVANFCFPQPIDPFRLQGSLNALLPMDIRILKIEAVSDNFHARFSAQGKIYHYHLHLESVQNPFKRRYSTHIRYSLDKNRLKEGARLFEGTHDFTTFANEAHRGSAVYRPVKTLKRLNVVDEPGGIRLEFEADGFLYKMVRNIVGTLLEVASNKRYIDEILVLLQSKDRKLAAMAAPPTGLFLHEVLY